MPGQGEGMRRKIESPPRVEVQEPGGDDPCDGSEHSDPQHDGQPGHALDAAIEQRHREDTDGAGRQAHLPGAHAATEVAQVLREADVAGGDLERPAEQELPDEQERQQGAEARAAESFAQVEVAAALARQRGGELGPYEAVA